MSEYLLSSITQALLVLIGVFILVFFMVRITGDPTAVMLARSQRGAAKFRHAMGFDRPLPVQFVDFVAKAIKGDFGNSLHYRLPALPLVLERLPATLQLAFSGLLMALVIAIPLGLIDWRAPARGST